MNDNDKAKKDFEKKNPGFTITYRGNGSFTIERTEHNVVRAIKAMQKKN